MWIPTLLLALIFFIAALKLARSNQSISCKAMLLVVGFLLALPGLLYFIYYFKILGDPIWLFRFRATPGSELAAGGSGFFIGLLHGYLAHNRKFRKFFSAAFFPVTLLAIIMVPYLKPLLLPVHWDDYPDKWSDDVCLQSSSSSCGAASTATLLRFLGKPEGERVIAREAFTSFTGTENWYLARVLRKRDVKVDYVKETSQPIALHYPAIAGVRVDGTGHFIVIMAKEGDKFVVGDPMTGREVLSGDDLRRRYEFTGFFMVVR
jgi:hypothetical protein